MRKLLNTLYVTNENIYMTLDGENVVCKENNEVKLRLPFSNVEAIFCFSYLGCSPALMGKCADYGIPINFISPSGRFLARVQGASHGNVLLRKRQYELFSKPPALLRQNTVAAKLANTKSVVKRTLKDYPQIDEDGKLTHCIERLDGCIKSVYITDDYDGILGTEGNGAKAYFDVFDSLILHQKDDFCFAMRSKRPPLDRVNAMLSFLYTIFTREYAAALESVGLDSYMGFYHSLRPGRESLACDLVEEGRCIVERFVLTLINLKIIKPEDFDVQLSGAVFLNDGGRKKVLSKWQEKKRTDMIHPYLKEKIPMGLLPYVQSMLLAKFVRGEIDEYPCYLAKEVILMMTLVSYDVSTVDAAGRKRLRKVAKECVNYGQRVQNSVFEVDVDYGTFLKLKDLLMKSIDEEQDSLRFYYLGNNWKRRVEHIGAKETYDPEGSLIL